MSMGQSAQAAQSNYKLSTVEQVVTNIDAYKPIQQTQIRLHAGDAQLSQAAKQTLDDIASISKTQPDYIIEVEGFSPDKDEAEKLADLVVRYLVVNHEIPVYRTYVVGYQPSASAGAPDKFGESDDSTRVQVSVLAKDFGTNRTVPAAASPPH